MELSYDNFNKNNEKEEVLTLPNTTLIHPTIMASKNPSKKIKEY